MGYGKRRTQDPGLKKKGLFAELVSIVDFTPTFYYASIIIIAGRER